MAIPEHAKPPLTVDRTKARDALADRLPDATDQEIDDALVTIDQEAEFDAERADLTVEVWDHASPVGGSTADEWRAKHNVDPDSEVYIVYRGGKPWIAQPHTGEPGKPAIPAGEGATLGNQHADRVAGGRAANRVTRKVAEHIEASR